MLPIQRRCFPIHWWACLHHFPMHYWICYHSVDLPSVHAWIPNYLQYHQKMARPIRIVPVQQVLLGLRPILQLAQRPIHSPYPGSNCSVLLPIRL